MTKQLTYGIIKKNDDYNSRDIGIPCKVNSKEEAIRKAKELARYHDQYGYRLWFAEYIDENGKHEPVPLW
jgi:hypothetical protein